MEYHICYLPIMFVIFLCSLAGVLCKYYKDNLIQRVGLCLICFGSVVRMYTSWIELSDLAPPRLILMSGMAIYGVGTVIKVWKDTITRGRRSNDRCN